MNGKRSQTASRRWLKVLRVMAAAALTVHALVHLMGVALLWQWGEPGELRYDDVRPEVGSTAAVVVGAVWLIAMLLFLLTAALLGTGRADWRPIGLVAAVVSIAVLLPSATIAWAGIVVDAAVIVGVVWAVTAAHRSARSPGGRTA